MIGELIADKYRVDLLVGTGGMGEVYRATSQEDGRAVAIKVLRSDLAENRTFRERFLQEAELTEKLDHENIVRVEEHGGLPDGGLYMVMELLEGDNLSEELGNSERIAWPRALWITQRILDALSQVHSAGMIHRDIKPENIFIVGGFQDRNIKLFDFGLAKSNEENEARRDLTQPGFAIGTPTYLAPERVTGRGADPRSDLYSLSVLLYEMLTGTTPFTATDLEEMLVQHLQKQPPPFSEVAPDAMIPSTVEMLVMRGLSKDPDHRYQSAAEYARAIESRAGRGL